MNATPDLNDFLCPNCARYNFLVLIYSASDSLSNFMSIRRLVPELECGQALTKILFFRNTPSLTPLIHSRLLLLPSNIVGLQSGLQKSREVGVVRAIHAAFSQECEHVGGWSTV